MQTADKQIKITLTFSAKEVAEILAHDVEKFDYFKKPAERWTIENDVVDYPTSTFQTLIEDVLSDIDTCHIDTHLAARVLAALQSEEEGE